ncbi:hypothetical protein [Neisseria sp. 74A18]|uniref:hypothetical protein n=1 Tax=Neisseria sp. 74A18 TaxID=1696094 RepID=UPI0006CAEF4D|nr:hypothetical protein [Neisseria sp. 74A18]KPN73892.1 hypothetical protein AKG43_05335 [Neisseria sp. 74A18]
MHQSSKLLILCACLSAFMLNACDFSNARAQTAAASAEVEAVVAQGNFLENAEALQAAETALKNLPQFRGKSLIFFENIDFFSGVRPRIELNIQNPHKPGQIDHYLYEHGKWRYTDTLRLTSETNVAANLTPLSMVRFADAATIAAKWAEKARSVDAAVTEPYYVSFVLLEKNQKRFWHTATIEAVGKQYYLSFHSNGTVWEFKKL